MEKRIQKMTIKTSCSQDVITEDAAIIAALIIINRLDAAGEVAINLTLIEVDDDSGYLRYPQVEDVDLDDIVIDVAAVYYCGDED